MVCEGYLSEFVNILSESEDILRVSQRAFGVIADRFHIGRVFIHFMTPASIYTKGGEQKENVLFEGKTEIDENPRYHRQFCTGEGGNFNLYLYCEKNARSYTEDEIRELDTISQILFFHCGRWRLINRVKKLTLTDNLTGLPNSGGYIAFANERMQQNQIERYTAFYFNLSCFSMVNKRFGTKEADMILQRYGQELTRFLTDGECVGRLGGDNFVALIFKERTHDFLNLIAGVEIYAELNGEEVPVTIRAIAGVYEINEPMEHCGMLIGECATALDIAKHIKNKPYEFVTQELRESVYKERKVAGSFPEALRRGMFKPYYQPKVDTDTYRIVGAEALARMEYGGKLVPPIEFIPILERNGMICNLDFYILEQVCNDIRCWMDIGIKPVPVSVNLSRKHLTNPNLAEDIMKVINKYQIDTSYIEIELTETVEETEQAQTIAFMKKMKQYNVRLSIDDFGTGYSSLNLLRFFPVDVLKIDRTFLNNTEENDRIVLSNIIRMASELHMDVVSEGVERWDQVDFLKQMTCNVVQGFLFDKPLPKAEFEEKLRRGSYDIKP